MRQLSFTKESNDNNSNKETQPLLLEEEDQKMKTPKFKELVKSLWKEEAVVWICFFFTLSLFPWNNISFLLLLKTYQMTGFKLFYWFAF